MTKTNLILFLGLIFSISTFSQEVRVHGVIIDTDGNPISNLTVFIPFTSKHTTTNEAGEYILENLQSGDIELTFRHLSFKPVVRAFSSKGGTSFKLDIVMERNTIEIEAIEKRADQANWEFGWEKFKEHVLGDPGMRLYTVENPKDLYFYYDGEKLTGHASKPLAIINDYLGYKLVYFLDYFWFEERKLLPDDPKTQISFAFSGSAFYVDRLDDFWLRRRAWKRNRKTEFKGTLRHFLISAFYDQITEQEYQVRRAWKSAKEFRESGNMSTALAYSRFNSMAKVFNWDKDQKKSGYLHYLKNFEYPIMEQITDLNQVPPAKTIQLSEPLLIFHFWDAKREMKDARITYLNIIPDNPDIPAIIKINNVGNHTVEGGKLFWHYLDNVTHLITALPGDYQPAKN